MLCNRDRKCKNRGTLVNKEVENLDNHDSPNFENLLTLKQIKKCGFDRVTHSKTTPRFTVQSAKQNCMATGHCSIWNFKLHNVKCIFIVNVNKPFMLIQSFFRGSLLSNWAYKMTDQGEENILGSSPLKTTIKKENRGLVWEKPVPHLWLSSSPNFLSNCWLSLVDLTEFIIQKHLKNLLLVWEFCVE